jgi:hypothetical protein
MTNSDAIGSSLAVNESAVERLLVGAIDLHCHSGPSIMPRKMNHAEAIRQAEAVHMKGVLFKDHYYCTAPVAELLKELMPETSVAILSGLVLNNHVGGLNRYAVEHGLKLGAKLVWMPTLSASNHIRHAHRKRLLPTKLPMSPSTGISVLDNRSEVVDEVKLILDLIAEHDGVLATGHLHISEIWPLLAEAKSRGVTRMLVNHPTFLIDANNDDMRELTAMGVYLEHSICQAIDCPSKKYEAEELSAMIQAGGVDHTIIGSDLGQAKNPTPVDGYREVIRLLLGQGYSEADIKKLVGQNAAKLIGLPITSASSTI